MTHDKRNLHGVPPTCTNMPTKCYNLAHHPRAYSKLSQQLVFDALVEEY